MIPAGLQAINRRSEAPVISGGSPVSVQRPATANTARPVAASSPAPSRSVDLLTGVANQVAGRLDVAAGFTPDEPSIVDSLQTSSTPTPALNLPVSNPPEEEGTYSTLQQSIESVAPPAAQTFLPTQAPPVGSGTAQPAYQVVSAGNGGGVQLNTNLVLIGVASLVMMLKGGF